MSNSNIGSAPARNRGVVQRHFEAKLACDAEVLAADLAPDVRWWAPQSTDRLGLPRPLEGRDAVVEMLVSVPLYEPGSRRWTMHHVVSDEAVVMVHATLQARTRANALYENNYVFVFELDDGRITNVWEHLDTAYAYERFEAMADE